MIYLFTFALSTFFAYLSVNTDKEKHKATFYCLAIISVIIPSVLAGVRSLSIGTDVKAYILPDYNAANYYTSITDFFSLSIYREKLYLLLVYVITHLFKNINILLFVFELIMMSCIYIGGYKNRKMISLPLLMILFFLFFYNNSFNMIRQYISALIVFFSVDYVLRKKYIKYIIMILIASLFHQTALCCLLLPVIHYFSSLNNKKRVFMFNCVYCFILLIICLFFSNIISWLINHNLLSDHYLFYISNTGNDGTNIFTLLIIIQLLFTLIIKKSNNKITDYNFYFINSLTALGLLQLSRTIAYGGRLALYFLIINLLFVSQYPNQFESKKIKRIIALLMIVIAFIYWIYVYVLSNSGQTYPYISIFH